MLIDFLGEDFASYTHINGQGAIDVTWNELVWAAITVGRPNWHYVLRYGEPSLYEALFRLSLLRMAVEQHGKLGRRLYQTQAYKSLDPTEKGSVSYFLGMIICKIFASKKLNAHWLLHLDVFGPSLKISLPGRSRPDLIGHDPLTNSWFAFECKGRSSKPSADTKRKAKQQASRIFSVGGIRCSANVGSIMYFSSGRLDLICADPPGQEENGIRVPLPEAQWEHYFRPVYSIYESIDETQSTTGRLARRSRDLDLEIGIHPIVLELLRKKAWLRAKLFCDENAAELKLSGYNPDGIVISTGATWSNIQENILG